MGSHDYSAGMEAVETFLQERLENKFSRGIAINKHSADASQSHGQRRQNNSTFKR